MPDPVPAPSPAVARQRLRQRIRRRSLADAALVILVAAVLAMPAADPHDSLRVGMAAIGIGILFFLIRRRADLAAVRAAREAERRSLEGRGISLAAWHGGAPLAGWAERPVAAPEKGFAEPA